MAQRPCSASSFCAVYDAASSAAAAGGRAASETPRRGGSTGRRGGRACRLRSALLIRGNCAARSGRCQRSSAVCRRGRKGALRTAQGRTWKAVLDGGAPLWCAVLGTVFLTVFLWAARKKLDDLTATTSQGALCSLAAEHPEAVCLNARKEWSGSRAERVYLACGQQGEGCNHHIILKQALCLSACTASGRWQIANRS